MPRNPRARLKHSRTPATFCVDGFIIEAYHRIDDLPSFSVVPRKRPRLTARQSTGSQSQSDPLPNSSRLVTPSTHPAPAPSFLPVDPAAAASAVTPKLLSPESSSSSSSSSSGVPHLSTVPPCRICLNSSTPRKIAVCASCRKGVHVFCLDPPRVNLPSDPLWRCPKCTRIRRSLKKEKSAVLRDALTAFPTLCTPAYVAAVASTVCGLPLSSSNIKKPSSPPSPDRNTVVVHLSPDGTDVEDLINEQICTESPSLNLPLPATPPFACKLAAPTDKQVPVSSVTLSNPAQTQPSANIFREDAVIDKSGGKLQAHTRVGNAVKIDDETLSMHPKRDLASTGRNSRHHSPEISMTAPSRVADAEHADSSSDDEKPNLDGHTSESETASVSDFEADLASLDAVPRPRVSLRPRLQRAAKARQQSKVSPIVRRSRLRSKKKRLKDALLERNRGETDSNVSAPFVSRVAVRKSRKVMRKGCSVRSDKEDADNTSAERESPVVAASPNVPTEGNGDREPEINSKRPKSPHASVNSPASSRHLEDRSQKAPLLCSQSRSNCGQEAQTKSLTSSELLSERVSESVFESGPKCVSKLGHEPDHECEPKRKSAHNCSSDVQSHSLVKVLSNSSQGQLQINAGLNSESQHREEQDDREQCPQTAQRSITASHRLDSKTGLHPPSPSVSKPQPPTMTAAHCSMDTLKKINSNEALDMIQNKPNGMILNSRPEISSPKLASNSSRLMVTQLSPDTAPPVYPSNRKSTTLEDHGCGLFQKARKAVNNQPSVDTKDTGSEAAEEVAERAPQSCVSDTDDDVPIAQHLIKHSKGPTSGNAMSIDKHRKENDVFTIPKIPSEGHLAVTKLPVEDGVVKTNVLDNALGSVAERTDSAGSADYNRNPKNVSFALSCNSKSIPANTKPSEDVISSRAIPTNQASNVSEISVFPTGQWFEKQYDAKQEALFAFARVQRSKSRSNDFVRQKPGICGSVNQIPRYVGPRTRREISQGTNEKQLQIPALAMPDRRRHSSNFPIMYLEGAFASKGSIDSIIQQNSPCASGRRPGGPLEQAAPLPIPQSSQGCATTHTPLTKANYNTKQPVLQTPLIASEDISQETASATLDGALFEGANHSQLHVAAAPLKRNVHPSDAPFKQPTYATNHRESNVLYPAKSQVGNSRHWSEMTTAQTTSRHLANSTPFSIYTTRDNHGMSDLNFASSGKLLTLKKRKRKRSLVGAGLSSGSNPIVREGSGRDVMASEKFSGRSTYMTDIAPSRTGTLPNISIDSASENLEIPRKAPFPEGGYQTTMSNSEACTARKSPVTVAPLEPSVTQMALERPYNDDPPANIIPGTPIHLRSMAGLPSPLDILPSEGKPLRGSEALCTRVYPKTGLDNRSWDISGDAHEKLGKNARASNTYDGAAFKGLSNYETNLHRGCSSTVHPPFQRSGTRTERKASVPFLSNAARRAQYEQGRALAFVDCGQGLRNSGTDYRRADEGHALRNGRGPTHQLLRKDNPDERQQKAINNRNLDNLRESSLVYRDGAIDGYEPNYRQPRRLTSSNLVPIMQEIDEQRTVERMSIGTGMRNCGRASMALSTNEVSEARNGPKSRSNNIEFTDGMALRNRAGVDDHGFSIGQCMNEKRYGDLTRQCPQTGLRSSALSSNKLNETSRTDDIVQVHGAGVCNAVERGGRNQSARCLNKVSGNECELPFVGRYDNLTLEKGGEANLTRGQMRRSGRERQVDSNEEDGNVMDANSLPPLRSNPMLRSFLS